jgi:hypothetical protein
MRCKVPLGEVLFPSNERTSRSSGHYKHSLADALVSTHTNTPRCTPQQPAAQRSTAQRSTAQNSASHHITSQHSTAQHGAPQNSTAHHRARPL